MTMTMIMMMLAIVTSVHKVATLDVLAVRETGGWQVPEEGQGGGQRGQGGQGGQEGQGGQGGQGGQVGH